MKAIIAEQLAQGAEAIVLGCTELPLALTQHDVGNDYVLFDTLRVIAAAADKKARHSS